MHGVCGDLRMFFVKGVILLFRWLVCEIFRLHCRFTIVCGQKNMTDVGLTCDIRLRYVTVTFHAQDITRTDRLVINSSFSSAKI